MHIFALVVMQRLLRLIESVKKKNSPAAAFSVLCALYASPNDFRLDEKFELILQEKSCII